MFEVKETPKSSQLENEAAMLGGAAAALLIQC